MFVQVPMHVCAGAEFDRTQKPARPGVDRKFKTMTEAVKQLGGTTEQIEQLRKLWNKALDTMSEESNESRPDAEAFSSHARAFSSQVFLGEALSRESTVQIQTNAHSSNSV